MDKQPAPIAFFCYQRPDLTLRSLNSLKANAPALESKLYIFSDGPKEDEQIKKNVEETRKVIRQESWCKEVEIIESEHNKGLYKNITEGIAHVLKFHDRVIAVEGDLLLAPDFLTFMNDCLDCYETRQDILSISGFKANVEVDTQYDVFLLPRPSSWGWATWANRWPAFYEAEKVEINQFLKQHVKEFRKLGDDLPLMLKKKQIGLVDSWAVIWTMAHFINETYAVFPSKSKVINIGFDERGTHSSESDMKFNPDLSSKPLKPYLNIKLDKNIIKQYNTILKKSLFQKLFHYLRYGIKP
jgi:hypothetical protein